MASQGSLLLPRSARIVGALIIGARTDASGSKVAAAAAAGDAAAQVSTRWS